MVGVYDQELEQVVRRANFGVRSSKTEPEYLGVDASGLLIFTQPSDQAVIFWRGNWYPLAGWTFVTAARRCSHSINGHHWCQACGDYIDQIRFAAIDGRQGDARSRMRQNWKECLYAP
jgi:hypothetical protein